MNLSVQKTPQNRLLRMLIAVALLFSGAPFVTMGLTKAFAASDTVFVNDQGPINYDGYSTTLLRVNGKTAWCAQPKMDTPYGNYTFKLLKGSDGRNSLILTIAALSALATQNSWKADHAGNDGDVSSIQKVLKPYYAQIKDCGKDREGAWYAWWHVVLSYCAYRVYGGEFGYDDPFYGVDDTSAWKSQSKAAYSIFESIADGKPTGGVSQEECDQVKAYAKNATIGITRTANSQNVIWVEDAPAKGKLKLLKKSSLPKLTEGNALYSLENARYEIYSDKDLDDKVGTLVTDKTGRTEPSDDLDEGTYYIKESSAPTGYKLDETVYKATVTVGETALVKFPAVEDVPLFASPSDFVIKQDSQTGGTAQGDAVLSGAVFEIKYYENGNASGTPARTWTLQTNAKGTIDFSKANETFDLDGKKQPYKLSGDPFFTDADGNVVLPLGSVTVQETKTPLGYNKPGPLKTAVIEKATSGKTAVLKWKGSGKEDKAETIDNDVIRGGIALYKQDDRTQGTPQGSASLSGIEFGIENASDRAVMVEGKLCEPGATVMTIATDEKGHASTAKDALPYGTYRVVEKKTNPTYLNTSKPQTVEVRENGVVLACTLPFEDTVVRGGVEFRKLDKESLLSTPLGGASIDGAVFTVTNESPNPVWVDGTLYKKGSVVKTLVAGEFETGVATTDKDRDGVDKTLPYGVYSLKETKPGEGYNIPDKNKSITFKIEKDGEVKHIDDKETFTNQVQRGDLSFQKKNGESGKRLAGIPFSITSKTTGERHIAVTDSNGCFSTRTDFNAHDSKTNGNDQAIGENNEVDESKLDDACGMWFGKTTEGNIVKADNSLGALPYDIYIIAELRCKANEGLALVKDEFVIDSRLDAKTLDFGTIDDNETGTPSIGTTAYDGESGTVADSVVTASKNTLINDRVAYRNLEKGKKYTLSAQLIDAKTKEPIVVEGKPVTASTAFVAETKDGYTVVKIPFDASGLQEGTRIVVFESLTDNGEPICDHCDPDDPSQTVIVESPKLRTTATDAASKGKTIVTDPKSCIVDTVSYSGLKKGSSYRLEAVLIDKSTGKPFEQNGSAVSSETTFEAESDQGTVETQLSFDSSSLKDDTELVVFEKLFENGSDVPLASHEDLSDQGQTVTVKRPCIETTAKDKATDTHEASADVKTTIVDTVRFEGLQCDGREYAVEGTLMTKTEKGEERPLLDGKGNPITARTSFIPETTRGTVDVTFVFDSSSLPDEAPVVVFEKLFREGVEIAAHCDINDENQTVTPHAIGMVSVARNPVDESKIVLAGSKTKIADTVSLENATRHRSYTLVGMVFDKDTKLPFVAGLSESDKKKLADEVEELKTLLGMNKGNGDLKKARALLSDPNKIVSKAAWGESSFEATSSSHEQTMTFETNATLCRDDRKLVCFEALFQENSLLARETNFENDDQTVELKSVRIATVAADGEDGDHRVAPQGNASVVDAIEYQNLTPGKTYLVKGTLMDKKTKKPLENNGEAVSSQCEFTPRTSSGTTSCAFSFDASQLQEGNEAVVFESLYEQDASGKPAGEPIALEENLDNPDQTVTITEDRSPTQPAQTPGSNGAERFAKTGNQAVAALIAIGVLGGLAIACLVARKKLASPKSTVSQIFKTMNRR